VTSDPDFKRRAVLSATAALFCFLVITVIFTITVIIISIVVDIVVIVISVIVNAVQELAVRTGASKSAVESRDKRCVYISHNKQRTAVQQLTKPQQG